MRPDLIVTQQNILAKSLGSNTIPWCLTLSSNLQSRADEALSSYYSFNAQNTSWNTWKKSVLSKQYLQSFHKNFDSGDYSKMRQFWGARTCGTQNDIPQTMRDNLKYEEADVISYQCSKTNTRIQAKTLRGVLMSEPAFQNQNVENGTALASDLFEEIVSLEENVFSWAIRGPRLYQSLLHPSSFHTSFSSEFPDIVALQEYDIHSSVAVYNQHEESFARAMRTSGYSGIFCSDPLLSRSPPSGVAIYFKHNQFDLCDYCGNILEIIDTNLIDGRIEQDNNDNAILDPNSPWTITLPCGSNIGNESISSNTQKEDSKNVSLPNPGPAVMNIDMKEQWSAKNQSSSVPKPTLLKDSDRRNAAFVRLRHKSTHQILNIINVHLMTTSRDGSNTNMYPGEVRSGELAILRNIVEQHGTVDHVPAEKQSTILCGDFNTCPDEIHVFNGNLPHIDSNFPNRTINTGYHPKSHSFQWSTKRASKDSADSLHLREAFTNIYKGKQKHHGTSRNADRSSWIDYMWYTPHSLQVSKDGLSNTRIPDTNLPNEQYGSDHLALTVGFQFRLTEGMEISKDGILN